MSRPASFLLAVAFLVLQPLDALADGPRVVVGGAEVVLDDADVDFHVENDFMSPDNSGLGSWDNYHTDRSSTRQQASAQSVLSLYPGLGRALARLRVSLHSDFEVVKAPDATALSNYGLFDISFDVVWMGVANTFTITTPIGVSMAEYFTNVETGVRRGSDSFFTLGNRDALLVGELDDSGNFEEFNSLYVLGGERAKDVVIDGALEIGEEFLDDYAERLAANTRYAKVVGAASKFLSVAGYILDIIEMLDQMDVDDVVRGAESIEIPATLEPRAWDSAKGETYQVFVSLNLATVAGSVAGGSALSDVDFKGPGNIYLDREDLQSRSVSLDERGIWLRNVRIRPRPVEGGAVDLALTDFRVSNTSPQPGEEITLYADVFNEGEGTSGYGRTGFFGGPDGQETLYEYFHVRFGAAEQQTARYFATFPMAGEFTLRAQADARNELAELDEANNGSASIDITVGDVRPDLAVRDLGVSKEYALSGQTISVTGRVVNLGANNKTPSAASELVVRAGSSVIGTISVPPLTSDMAHDFSAAFQTSALGPLQISATADIGNAITEADESNNAASAQLMVGDWDFRINDVALLVYPDQIGNYQRVLWSAVAENVCTAGGPRKASVQFMRDGQQDSAHAVTLPCNQPTTVVASLPHRGLQLGSTVTIAARADADEVVEEIAEGNNKTGRTFSVAVNQPSLTSLAAEFEDPGHVLAGSTINLVANVSNTGSIEAQGIDVAFRRIRNDLPASQRIQPLGSRRIDSLPAGSSSAVTLSYPVPATPDEFIVAAAVSGPASASASTTFVTHPLPQVDIRSPDAGQAVRGRVEIGVRPFMTLPTESISRIALLVDGQPIGGEPDGPVLGLDKTGVSYTMSDLVADLGNVTMQAVSLGADDSVRVPLGFEFDFYGSRYDEIFVKSDGWLSFTDPSAGGRNRSLPQIAHSDLIAPFWDDLKPPPGTGNCASAGVCYATAGTPPYRRFIVSYRNMAMDPSGRAYSSFQTVLRETSNEIVFGYVNGTGGSATLTPTIGVDRGDGASALLYGHEPPASGEGVLFYPQLAWSWDTDRFAEGSHTLTAELADIAGNSTTDSITVIVDRTQPTCAMAGIPRQLRGKVTVSPTVADAHSGVERVELLVDKVSLVQASASPYPLEWDTSIVADGSHEVAIVAHDRAGNTCRVATTVQVDNTPPLAGIVEPEPGALVRGLVPITVGASDSSGIRQVRFMLDQRQVAIDRAAPFAYSWDTRRISVADVGLAVEIQDNAGNVTTDQMPLVVDNRPDCNANGVADVIDISRVSSADCDRDGVPDECEAAPPVGGTARRTVDGFESGTLGEWTTAPSSQGLAEGRTCPGSWNAGLVSPGLNGAYAIRLVAEADRHCAPWRTDAAVEKQFEGLSRLQATVHFDAIQGRAGVGHSIFQIRVSDPADARKTVVYDFAPDNSVGDYTFTATPGQRLVFDRDVANDYAKRFGEALPATALVRFLASADYPERLRQTRRAAVRVDDLIAAGRSAPVTRLPVEPGTAQDCNKNRVADSCDIANGTSIDRTGDGIPDECAQLSRPQPGQAVTPDRVPIER